MLKRSPKLKPKTFSPNDSGGFVIAPPCCKEPLTWWKVRGRIWRKVPKSLADRARRQVEMRQRQKPKGRNNQLRCIKVWMTKRNVFALLNNDNGWEPPQQNQMTPHELSEYFDKEWMNIAGGVIALAAISTIKRKK